MTRRGSPASASSSSRTSPAVTDRTVPPLAATISAVRCTVCRPAAAETPGSWSHSACSRPNPSPSRVRARPRTRAPLPRASADTSQPSEGRTRSAQIATVSAAHNSACRPSRCRPRSCSHAAGSCRQPAPARSAPLASHRSCQCLAWLRGQPVQQQGQPADASLLALGIVQHERRAGQPLPGGVAWLQGGGPAVRHGPRRGNARASTSRAVGAAGGATSGRPDDGGHHAPFPNSTSSVSGR